jgi:hypothetical protein
VLESAVDRLGGSVGAAGPFEVGASMSAARLARVRPRRPTRAAGNAATEAVDEHLQELESAAAARGSPSCSESAEVGVRRPKRATHGSLCTSLAQTTSDRYIQAPCRTCGDRIDRRTCLGGGDGRWSAEHEPQWTLPEDARTLATLPPPVGREGCGPGQAGDVPVQWQVSHERP